MLKLNKKMNIIPIINIKKIFIEHIINIATSKFNEHD